MVLTILFDFWSVDLCDESFLAPPKPFSRSFINRMLSHTSKPSYDAPPEEEEELHELEHTSPPPIPPSDPYSTLLASMNQLTVSPNKLRDDFYSTASHFAASQRLVKLHLIWIQHYLGYEIPLSSQSVHPLPPTGPPFPLYDPWSAPTSDYP